MIKFGNTKYDICETDAYKHIHFKRNTIHTCAKNIRFHSTIQNAVFYMQNDDAKSIETHQLKSKTEYKQFQAIEK